MLKLNYNNSLTYNSLNSFIRPSKGLYSRFTNILSPITNSDNGYIKNIFLLRKYYELNQEHFFNTVYYRKCFFSSKYEYR